MKYEYDHNRLVGTESRRTYSDKIESGFFDKYMTGLGAEIGYAGYVQGVVPILENCDGYDLTTPGYDGKTIPRYDQYYSWVYSSHTLEHISDFKQAIQEWYRITRIGGYIITVVPHRDLYEKKLELPSKWNGDHKRFFTPASLLKEFEDSLPHNSFRVRQLRDNDKGHDYNQPATEHSLGEYEIELVIERIK